MLEEGNQDQVDRILSYQEQHAYLAVAGKTLCDVATPMIETGMRPEEIAASGESIPIWTATILT